MPVVIATKAEFQTATDLTFVTSAKRPSDTILQRIDLLLDLYHGTEEEKAKIMFLGRIYFATDMWLRICDRGDPSVNVRRRPSVYTFYTAVVNRLCELTGIAGKQNLLPNWLTETFGKNMVEHGVEVDITSKAADYLAPDKAAKYKLSFVGGMAYQQSWWTNSADLVLANTIGVDDQTGGQGQRPIAVDSGGYVVTLSGEFYHGPHYTNNGSTKGRFHSSYLAGEAVKCAGVMKIQNGKVIRIDTDSGHYQPGDPNLVMAVEALAAYGVKMADLRVKPFGKAETTGQAFLAEANAGRIEFTDARMRPEPIHRALDGARVSETLRAHEATIDRAAAFAILKRHWKPKNTGGQAHGPFGKDACRECKSLSFHWPLFEAAMRAAGGVDRVSTERAAAAAVMGPLTPAPLGPAPAILGGYAPPLPPDPPAPAQGYRGRVVPRPR
ncbi:MAG TPA: hypothetical protein VGM67_06625 [Gemmatimonadaceae bacterium]|jgi:hypothetical protein